MSKVKSIEISQATVYLVKIELPGSNTESKKMDPPKDQGNEEGKEEPKDDTEAKTNSGGCFGFIKRLFGKKQS